MSKATKKWAIDAAERVGTTVVYGIVSVAITELSGISDAWAPVLIVGLTTLKTFLAKKIGDGSTASILPGVENDVAVPEGGIQTPGNTDTTQTT